jgi:hypothetical protein
MPKKSLEIAVKQELAIFEKEIELLKLRVAESEGDLLRNKTLRSFGSCLWKHQKAMKGIQKLCNSSP